MTHRNGRYNRGVEALTKDDIYQWNPWRAPGSAPVYDPCGMAGGSPEWTSTQLSFIDTVNNYIIVFFRRGEYLNIKIN